MKSRIIERPLDVDRLLRRHIFDLFRRTLVGFVDGDDVIGRNFLGRRGFLFLLQILDLGLDDLFGFPDSGVDGVLDLIKIVKEFQMSFSKLSFE